MPSSGSNSPFQRTRASENYADVWKARTLEPMIRAQGGVFTAMPIRAPKRAEGILPNTTDRPHSFSEERIRMRWLLSGVIILVFAFVAVLAEAGDTSGQGQATYFDKNGEMIRSELIR